MYGSFTKKLNECRSKLDYLIYWFKYGWQFGESIPQEIEQSDELKGLVRESEIAAFNKEKRTIYDLSLMTERDILTEKLYAKEEGRAEGRAEGHADGLQEGLNKGRAEEAKAIALSMKQAGMTSAVIAQITKLPIEQVEALK